jgi:hypothetical protein
MEELKRLILERKCPDSELDSLPALTQVRIDYVLNSAISSHGDEIKRILEANPEAVVNQNTLGQLWITLKRSSRYRVEIEKLFHYGPELNGHSSYKLLHQGCKNFIEDLAKRRKDVKYRSDMKSQEFLRENKCLEVQDRAYIAGRLLGFCEVLNDSAKTSDEKNSAAFEAGQLLQAFITESRVSATNRLIAQKNRPKEIDKMIKKLARKDAPAKALWRELYGLLDEEGLQPEEDQETLKYSYKDESDKKQVILFTTFSTKLSTARRGQFSR